ncbi:MAG: PEP-CTERM sorting domain-containing protein [Verrucomicrobia bacterium]|nr:PEP-CTERM sorting domain-containing protein [Verrucomicrobiota bacterium]
MNFLLRKTTLVGGIAVLPAAAFANGGDTFGTATPIPAGPLSYSDTGTTLGANNTVNSLLANVNGLYSQVAGPDVFYILQIAVGGTLTFTVDPTGANWDTSIYVTNSLATAANPGIGAGSGADSFGSNGTESVTVNVTPGTYYLVIDSFYASGALSAGTYSMTLTGTAIAGTVAAVPEPGTVLGGLAAVGTLGGAVWRRRRVGAK